MKLGLSIKDQLGNHDGLSLLWYAYQRPCAYAESDS